MRMNENKSGWLISLIAMGNDRALEAMYVCVCVCVRCLAWLGLVSLSLFNILFFSLSLVVVVGGEGRSSAALASVEPGLGPWIFVPFSFSFL